MATKQSAYAEAGVDIDVMMTALRRAKRRIKATATSGVVGDVGSFGGLYRTPGARGRLLVASIDGVGTKLKVAHLAGIHHTVGQDLVNHCVNDILVQGARPLFFMDYLGAARLEPEVFDKVIEGFCKACRANGCALLGGETAEMPGLYPDGEYDLVGAVVGEVETRRLVSGKGIRHGDVLLGLPSSGLHTNGYSLARRVIFDRAGLGPHDPFPGTRKSVAEVLLQVHRGYLKPVSALLDRLPVKGLAHITGGGLVDNLPRVLPQGLRAVIDRGTWNVPRVFQFIQEKGGIDRDEMFRVFNMGIGMVVVVRARQAEEAMAILDRYGPRPRRIGHVETGPGRLRFADG